MSLSRLERICLACTGIILPIVCFLRTVETPEVQSGHFGDYSALVLSNTPWVFCPFLLYAAISMLLVLIQPGRFSRYLLVRFGVYTGIILALQFALVWTSSFSSKKTAFSGVTLLVLGWGLFVTLIPLGLGWLIRRLIRRFGRRPIWLAIGIAVGGTYALSAVLSRSAVASASVVIAVMIYLPLVAAPFWAVAAFVWLSVRLYQNQLGPAQFRLAHALGAMSWLTAYMAAWRLSVTRAVEEYEALPEPLCYVCTAAAKGHPRVVQSLPVRMSDGSLLWVNPQMRYFKCAELALMALAPKTHRLCRMLYDRIGPSLARVVVGPFSANVAYLALKPLEWSTRVLLWLLLPGVDNVLGKLYRSGQNG